MVFSPRPSMSKAGRETKWISRSTRWAGQIRPPVQRRTTSPGGRTAWLPQAGGGGAEGAAGAGAHALTGGANGVAAAGGAEVGEDVGFGVRRPAVEDDRD